MFVSVHKEFRQFVEDWCSAEPLIGHCEENPRFFLSKGAVPFGAEDFVREARPNWGPVVQMDMTRSVGYGDKFEPYSVNLYFCVRADSMGVGTSEDDATDYADYISHKFKSYFLRERDENGNRVLMGAVWHGGISVPRFHDGWVAMSVTISLRSIVNRCLDE